VGGKRIGQDRVEEEHTQSVLLVTKELSLSGSLSVSGVQSWNVSKTIKKILLQWGQEAERKGVGDRGGIFKLLRSPGIDSKELIPPAYMKSVLEFLISLWGLETG
jgi:hypothetical protein